MGKGADPQTSVRSPENCAQLARRGESERHRDQRVAQCLATARLDFSVPRLCAPDDGRALSPDNFR
jgi:hypothetical protein